MKSMLVEQLYALLFYVRIQSKTLIWLKEPNLKFFLLLCNQAPGLHEIVSEVGFEFFNLIFYNLFIWE